MLEILDHVTDRRETFVITKRGKAVAKLVPVALAVKGPVFGRLRGFAEEVGDIMRPAASPEDWAFLREWDELVGTSPELGPDRVGGT